MKAAKGFLTVDYYIQTILGIACIGLSFVLYGLILLIPFGIWQVISSLVLVFGFGDKKRIPHLVFVTVWATILSMIIFANFESFAFFCFYIILLPACIGVWYYIITRKDYLLVKEKRTPIREETDEILDIEI